MLKLLRRALGAMSLVFVGLGSAAAENRMPIEDGVYLTKEHCDLFNKQELELVQFSVSKNGSEISFGEGYCVPAVVKKVREGRFHITADCDEMGELYTHSFFLDVKPGPVVILDGEEKPICRPQKSVEKTVTPVAVPRTKPFPKKVFSKKEAQVLIRQWLKEYEGCQGSGDDPKTLKACQRRGEVIAKLEAGGWCYGKETDSSRSEYDWHLCGHNSLRHNLN